ncbi:ABC transporter ATP-binding protein [Fretibacterium fastidiosum]|uniref:ABC-type antimicrobial peptide transport system, ATPase component n=1 Tax=Fretibacterium fastidiosum TaxID=651822 RepID=A0AB94IVB2_9BACT|nr:ABC transporter ATP-binding protein [Fretibacterium fastidiosum]CBL27683.1 ABC-type antimicrobial peptide transport system, ATPase component [Fretibacterium fastidiosum]
MSLPDAASERAACPLIEVEDLVKVYRTGDVELRALDGVSFSVAHGEFVAVMGPSGSGKSTTMNMLGCLDSPTDGRYLLDGRDVAHLSGDELAKVRNGKLGFVFQGFNLLPRLSAVDNVALPLVYAGVPARERRERARGALERVGLGARLEHRPNQMSGGQQQRVAIARALVGRAPLILADEPTGNLDTRTSEEIMDLLVEVNREGKTVVLVTHEPDIAAYARRILKFKDGRLVSDETASGREE